MYSLQVLPCKLIKVKGNEIKNEAGREGERANCNNRVQEENKSQYWPCGAPKHAETAENEKA